MLPVLLYHAWQNDGSIPDSDVPKARSSTKAAAAEAKKEKLLQSRRCIYLQDEVRAPGQAARAPDSDTAMSRNYQKHYSNVLNMCTSIRIWSSQSITPDEARRAQECHARACWEWASMNCHLSPYCHLLMHHTDFILRLGPTYTFWLFGPERNNGWLSHVNTNGHIGGELEATMMRSWVKNGLLQDLVSHSILICFSPSHWGLKLQVNNLESLPDKTPGDLNAISSLRSYVKGDAKPTRVRGSLLNIIAQQAHKDDVDEQGKCFIAEYWSVASSHLCPSRWHPLPKRDKMYQSTDAGYLYPCF